MQSGQVLQAYLAAKQRNFTSMYGSWPRAKQLLRSKGRNQLVQEIKADVAAGWQDVCKALHTLQQDDVLSIVVETLGLVYPAESDVAEFVADALLLACDLPSRWWRRNGAFVAIGAGVLLVVAAIGRSGSAA